MVRRKPPLENLARIVYLDFLWGLRVPQSVFYQFVVTGVLLFLLARVNGSPGYLGVLVPGLIGLLTASQAMQVLGGSISYMRAYGAWRTVRGGPIPTPMYLAGLVLSRLVRILLLVGFVLALAQWMLGYDFQGNLALVAAYVVLGVAVFAALGLVVTYLISAPQAVTSVLSMLLLLLVLSSNTLFIAEARWLELISWLSPLTYLSRLLRAASGGAAWDTSLLADLAVLAVWGVALALIALRLANRRVEET
jgi:ABC-2 type transport system permease protein